MRNRLRWTFPIGDLEWRLAKRDLELQSVVNFPPRCLVFKKRRHMLCALVCNGQGSFQDWPHAGVDVCLDESHLLDVVLQAETVRLTARRERVQVEERGDRAHGG